MNQSFLIPRHLIEFFHQRSAACTYDSLYFSHLKPIYAKENEGKCICTMKVASNHLNIGGSVHGGLTASIIDSVTTAALFNTPKRKTGVSINLNISYIKAAKLNDNLIIDAHVKQVCGKLAFLEANIYQVDNVPLTEEFLNTFKHSKIIASGAHTKYLLD